MEKPYLSIIIPCYKEEKNLQQTFPIFIKFVKSQNYSTELVFIEDGSPDNTTKFLQDSIKDYNFCRLIIHKKNLGKGMTVRDGMLIANGEVLLFADADNATPIEQSNKLLSEIKNFDVVIGSRYKEKGHLKIKQPFYRILGARFLNFMFKIFTGLKIQDSQCGFKMFKAKPAKEIFSRQTFSRFSFDIEILAIAKYLKYSIKEIPVDWYAKEKSTVHPVRDGFKFLWALIILRWNFLKGIYKKPNIKISNI